MVILAIFGLRGKVKMPFYQKTDATTWKAIPDLWTKSDATTWKRFTDGWNKIDATTWKRIYRYGVPVIIGWGDTNIRLYSLDVNNFSLTLIGSTQTITSNQQQSIACFGDNYLLANENFYTMELYTVDFSDGSLTSVNTTNNLPLGTDGTGATNLNGTNYVLRDSIFGAGAKYRLYSINSSNANMTQIGNEQTIFADNVSYHVRGVGLFSQNNTLYAIIRWALTGTSIRLFSINTSNATYTSVGNNKTLSGVSDCQAVGAFVLDDVAYTLVGTGNNGGIRLYSINTSDGNLTQIGNELTLSGINSQITGIGCFNY